MGNFNRDNRSGGRRDFNRPSMHKATCSKCGNECEVPFIPTSGKPVFCSQCFEKNGSSSPRRFDRGNSGRPNFDDKRMYQAVCASCGSNCSLPFQPRSGKPVYCSKCFEDKGRRSGGDAPQYPQYKEQFAALDAKLDQILKILTPVVPVEELKPAAIVKKPVAKPAKKKSAAKKQSSAKSIEL